MLHIIKKEINIGKELLSKIVWKLKVRQVKKMSNKIKLLDDDFIKIVKAVEQDILETRFNIIAKANKEVIDFYLRLGK